VVVRKLHDFEVTRAAALAFCKRDTVRAYLQKSERMKPATRARVEAALRTLGLFSDQGVALAANIVGAG
jgi:DNA-binding LacI/PurR family transcriptional regulator